MSRLVSFEIEDEDLRYILWSKEKYGFQTLAGAMRFAISHQRRTDIFYKHADNSSYKNKENE